MLDDAIRMHRRRRYVRFLFPSLAALPIPFFVYALIASAPDGFPLALPVAMLAYICVLVAVMAIISERDRILDHLLRASAVPQPYQRRLQEICEEVFLASGLQPPRLMYVDRDGMNAFASGWREKGTIYLTRGLLEGLSHGETLAVIAHETARLNAGYSYAAEIRTSLGAFTRSLDLTGGSLKGLLLSGLGILLVVLLLFALLPHFLLNTTGNNGMVTALYFVVMLPLVLMVIRALDSGLGGCRDKFFLADDLAVKWTMDPEALVSAMRKMQPLYAERAYGFLQRLAFVPHIPHRTRPARDPDTPVIVSGARETNMPLPGRVFAERRPDLPSVAERERALQESVGHPI
ncbi:MAG: M48 family metalloprotease [Actinomycetota bacterium]